jgi:23S rRNA (pseudouridine1915-N3)-methyltransferase
MPREILPRLVTIPLPSRKSQQSAASQQQRESSLILDKLTPGSMNIALDERGRQWSSLDWSRSLQNWMFEFPRVNLIIGGPDGLSEQCIEACQQRVSLGRMTMPHALVKIVLLEQLYRAWTILKGHPYHRE